MQKGRISQILGKQTHFPQLALHQAEYLYICRLYEESPGHNVLLAADRRVGGAEVGEVR
jgi:hypothetical protein